LEGTIIPLSGEPILREGVIEFLEKQRKKEISILSRMTEKEAKESLEKLGIHYENLYSREIMATSVDAVKEIKEGGINRMQDVTDRKIPPKYFSLVPMPGSFLDKRDSLENSVIISSHQGDIDLVKFRNLSEYLNLRCGIKVPHYQNGEEDFSFSKLSLNPIKLNWDLYRGRRIKDLSH